MFTAQISHKVIEDMFIFKKYVIATLFSANFLANAFQLVFQNSFSNDTKENQRSFLCTISNRLPGFNSKLETRLKLDWTR